MPEPKPGWEARVVDDPMVAQPPNPAEQKLALGMLMLGIKTLTQRAYVAILDTFSLITVAAAFWLWLSIPDPNIHQLIGLGMFALFALAMNTIVRRK